MPYFLNRNPNFGLPGPYYSESAQDLGDQMLESFHEWTKETDPANQDRAIQSLRNEFLRGLEEMQ